MLVRIAVAWTSAWSLSAFAITTFEHSERHTAPFVDISNNAQRVEVTPLFSPIEESAFNLLSPDVSLLDQTTSLLREAYAIAREISIDPVDPLSNPSETENLDFTFSLAGIPFCDLRVRTHRIKGKPPMISGNAPSRFTLFRSLDFSKEVFSESLQTLTNHLQNYLSLAGIGELVSQSSCVAISDQTVTEAWEIKFSSNSRNFRAIVGTTQVFSIDELQFHLIRQGIGHVYPRNPMNAATKAPFPLPDLNDSGNLTSALFYTTPCRETRVSSSDGVFDLATSSIGYQEVSVFTNAHKMRAFYQSLGFTEPTPPQMQLVLHEVFTTTATPPCSLTPNPQSNTSDNALYTPAFGSTGPRISIGDGSGHPTVGLKTLQFEADVVGHEYGHHVVFKVMTATTGQSLEIHEAMADIFVMLKNDDPCFSPSICPTNSTACFVKNQCLRTANQNLTFNDSSLPPKEHLRGQIISGMFWDLRDEPTISADAAERLSIVKKIAFGSIGYLKATSSRKDLVLAMVTADQATLNGAHTCQIFAAATVRGLISEADDECLHPKATLPETETPDPTTSNDSDDDTDTPEAKSEKTASDTNTQSSPTQPIEKKSSSSPSFCGIGTGIAGSNFANFMGLLLMCIGAIPALWKRRDSANF